MQNDYRPVLFFSNPNIYPQEEYLIRKNELTRYDTELGLQVIDDDYDHQLWLQQVAAGRENEPERGSRCLECFRMRMLRSARKCKELGLTTCTTTLASSRWKDLEQVNRAGEQACLPYEGRLKWWPRNWRKGGLQPRRSEIIREQNFYNQSYCGCEFSK